MELFPAHPDLSLQINKPSSHENDLGFCSTNANSNPAPVSVDLSLSHTTEVSEPGSIPSAAAATPNHGLHHCFDASPFYGSGEGKLTFFRPVRGFPAQEKPLEYSFIAHDCHHHHQQLLQQQHRFLDARILESTASVDQIETAFSASYNYMQPRSEMTRSRLGKSRNTRAPRMRWTTWLRARFAYAVDLLGGPERATPKSVLELMDVKDLTLAHVKSHLQMYRTVKSTERTASYTGQSYQNQNGCLMKTLSDNFLPVRNRRRKAVMLRGKLIENSEKNIQSTQKNMKPRCSSNDQVSDILSSSSISEICMDKPSLEFTLGRPH